MYEAWKEVSAQIKLPNNNAQELEYQAGLKKLVQIIMKFNQNNEINVVYEQSVGASGLRPDGIIVDPLICNITWSLILIPIEIKTFDKTKEGRGQSLSYGSRILLHDRDRKFQLTIFTNLKLITFFLISNTERKIFECTKNLLQEQAEPSTGFELLFLTLSMTPEHLGKKLPNQPSIESVTINNFLSMGGSSYVWKARYNNFDVVVKNLKKSSGEFQNELDVLNLLAKKKFPLKVLLTDVKLNCLILYPCGRPLLFLKEEEISKNLSNFMSELKNQLQIAHSLQIYHHDIRPHNIIVSEDKPILIDWGLANMRIEEEYTLKGHRHYLPSRQLDKYSKSKGYKYGSFSDIEMLGWTYFALTRPKHHYELPWKSIQDEKQIFNSRNLNWIPDQDIPPLEVRNMIQGAQAEDYKINN